MNFSIDYPSPIQKHFHELTFEIIFESLIELFKPVLSFETSTRFQPFLSFYFHFFTLEVPYKSDQDGFTWVNNGKWCAKITYCKTTVKLNWLQIFHHNSPNSAHHFDICATTRIPIWENKFGKAEHFYELKKTKEVVWILTNDALLYRGVQC